MGVAQQHFKYSKYIFFSFFFLICKRKLKCNKSKVRNSVVLLPSLISYLYTKSYCVLYSAKCLLEMPPKFAALLTVVR